MVDMTVIYPEECNVGFQLLGPLEVSIDGRGRPIRLASSRQRVILAVLLLHEGHVVSLSRLVDALWDSEPPATAKSQVQTCISALRRQLRDLGADGLLSTTSVGYQIRVPAGSLDVANFARLASRGRAAAADGRAEEAARDYRAALALWRGPAVFDVESRVAQSIGTRLNEDRLRITEECLDLELTLGRHRQLVAELGELVTEHPLREMMRAQHMLALYRSGRQAEALKSFEAIREILLNELGLEPGERLCALQRAILAKDSALDVQPSADQAIAAQRQSDTIVPCQLPAAIGDFTGRQKLLEALISMLSDTDRPAAQRNVPLACLNGKGGVGKTELALQAAHAVRSHYPDGQLFLSLQDPSGQPADPMDLTAGVLNALGLPQLALPGQLADRTSVYRSWLANRKVLIVLDDVESVSQITNLIPGNPSCGMIITSKHPLPSLPGARHFMVDHLEEAASIELLEKVIGAKRVQADPPAARALVQLCDCLPLAVRIVAAKLAARRHWSLAQMVARLTDEARRLDELALGGLGIRPTLAISYGGLSQEARRLFQRLSFQGTSDFASWVSAPLLGEDVNCANDVLEELVEARLIEVRVSEDGSSRFQLHDLVRIYARERLSAEESPSERAVALQRLLACWLSLAVEAHRRVYGGDHGLHGRAEFWTLPARVHDQLLAKPLNWFRLERTGLMLAITEAAQVGLDDLCWDLAVTVVTLFELDYRVEDWQKTHELALEAVRRAGNVRGEAAVLFSLGNLALNGGLSEAPRYLAAALHAFEQVGEKRGRVLALGALAFVDRLNGRCFDALTRYQQMLAGCRNVGDRPYEVDALANLAQIHTDWENYSDAQQLLDQALVICGSLEAPRLIAQTKQHFGELYLRLGDLWRAERCFRFVLQTVRAEGDVVGEAYALAGLGAVRTRQEQWELARADLSAALSLSRRMTTNLVHGRVLQMSAELCLVQAEPERATTLISEALVIYSETGTAPVWRARFLELKARIDDQVGNPTAAYAARREALALVGDADPGLARTLASALRPAAADPAAETRVR